MHCRVVWGIQLMRGDAGVPRDVQEAAHGFSEDRHGAPLSGALLPHKLPVDAPAHLQGCCACSWSAACTKPRLSAQRWQTLRRQGAAALHPAVIAIAVQVISV